MRKAREKVLEDLSPPHDGRVDLPSRWSVLRPLLKKMNRRSIFSKNPLPTSFDRLNPALGFECAFCNLAVLTASVFCAFGARRLVSRGELGWFMSSFAGRVSIEVLATLVRSRMTNLFETAMYGLLTFSSRIPVSASRICFYWRPFARCEAALACGLGSHTQTFAAFACGALIIAATTHSIVLRYVDEADVFSALVLGAMFVRSFAALSVQNDEERRQAWSNLVAPPPKEGAKPSVSSAAVISEVGDMIAIIGDGGNELFERIVRGVNDVQEAGVIVSPREEWILPELVDARVNPIALGSAASRIDDVCRSRLCETLEESLCSSSRFVKYLSRAEECRQSKDDATCSTAGGYACAIGIERARCTRARVLLVNSPFHEVNGANVRRRLMRATLTCRHRSCIFTTSDISVLPFCDRIVLTEGEDVLFIGDWRSMIQECDTHVIHRAFLYSLRPGLERKLIPRVVHPLPCETNARVNFVDLRRLREGFPQTLGVVACAGLAPALSLYTFERWLVSKRTSEPSNSLLYASVGLFAIYVTTSQMFKTLFEEFPRARAISAVVFIALAAGLSMWSVVTGVIAFAIAIFIAWIAYSTMFASLRIDIENMHVRLAHFTARASHGATHIRVAKCDELYLDVLTNLLQKLRSFERRREIVEAMRQLFCSIFILLSVAIGLWKLGDDEPSRRGTLAFIALQAFDSLIDFGARELGDLSTFDRRDECNERTSVRPSSKTIRRTSSSFL